jgi:hypothetical protein
LKIELFAAQILSAVFIDAEIINVFFFYCLEPHKQFFSCPAAVPIIGDKAANLNLRFALLAFRSKNSFTCHTCCDLYMISFEGVALALVPQWDSNRRCKDQHIFMLPSNHYATQATEIIYVHRQYPYTLSFTHIYVYVSFRIYRYPQRF